MCGGGLLAYSATTELQQRPQKKRKTLLVTLRPTDRQTDTSSDSVSFTNWCQILKSVTSQPVATHQTSLSPRSHQQSGGVTVKARGLFTIPLCLSRGRRIHCLICQTPLQQVAPRPLFNAERNSACNLAKQQADVRLAEQHLNTVF